MKGRLREEENLDSSRPPPSSRSCFRLQGLDAFQNPKNLLLNLGLGLG